MLSLRGDRQALRAAPVVLLVLLWTALAQADPFWIRLRQGRPHLARAALAHPTPMQMALLAYYEGNLGEAWQRLHGLEQSYAPGTQPPEFFWLRALLLQNDNWELAAKNLEPLTHGPLRLEALLALAQGWCTQNPGQSQRYWKEAVALAQSQQDPAQCVRLALTQARMQGLRGQWEEAQATLLTARALSISSCLPALTARIEKRRAESQTQLAQWDRFGPTCLSALQWARSSGESDEVESIAQLWVDQQLNRRSEEAGVQQCWQGLNQAQGWFQATARVALLRQRARLEALALNQRQRARETLGQALSLAPDPRWRLILMAERANLTEPSQKEARREALMDLMTALEQGPPLQAEDPLRKALPRYGCWAALGDTYLPESPEKAEECFEKARQQADGLSGRLEVLNFQLMRYNAAGALAWSRKTLGLLLQVISTQGLDRDASRILRSQMFALRSETRQLTRLLMTDEIRPAPEAPSMLVLTEMLRQTRLQSALEQEIYQRLRDAREPREKSEAYYARAELLLAQSRWGEALLALQRSLGAAQEGGWTLRQALALRSLADTDWLLGQGEAALEAVSQAEALYRSSANSRDQRSAQDCRLLKAYFLMRLGRYPEAMQSMSGESAWTHFLRGRCYLAQNQIEAARREFLESHFEEGLAEVGRLIFLARSSPAQESLTCYAQAFGLARHLGSLTVRDVALPWMARLRELGQEEQALQVQQEASQLLRALLQEYPGQVRERLLDLPETQRLLGPSLVQEESAPRHSRREFLARLNALQQRYPQLDSWLALSPSEMVAIQESLPAGRTLVQYFAADTDLYCMCLDAEECRVVQVAVERPLLEQWVKSLRQSLSQGQKPDREASRRLYAALVEPCQWKTNQVQVIPNGFLWYLPWDVLQDNQGRYLVENLDLSCVSPAELVRSGFTPAEAAPVTRVLAVGGVSPRLPATEQEARTVAGLFPEGKALLGTQASLGQLQSLAPQAQVLHFATHSALGADLNQSYIELADGPLRLEQIYGLTLRGGSLVVLSSCESALGQAQPGREVASLASAFLNSGAACVVATLWKVDDQDSAQFFARFYPYLRQGMSPAQALRRTRLDCLGESPGNWAAYQLIGGPGT